MGGIRLGVDVFSLFDLFLLLLFSFHSFCELTLTNKGNERPSLSRDLYFCPINLIDELIGTQYFSYEFTNDFRLT